MVSSMFWIASAANFYSENHSPRSIGRAGSTNEGGHFRHHKRPELLRIQALQVVPIGIHHHTVLERDCFIFPCGRIMRWSSQEIRAIIKKVSAIWAEHRRVPFREFPLLGSRATDPSTFIRMLRLIAPSSQSRLR